MVIFKICVCSNLFCMTFFRTIYRFPDIKCVYIKRKTVFMNQKWNLFKRGVCKAKSFFRHLEDLRSNLEDLYMLYKLS